MLDYDLLGTSDGSVDLNGSAISSSVEARDGTSGGIAVGADDRDLGLNDVGMLEDSDRHPNAMVRGSTCCNSSGNRRIDARLVICLGGRSAVVVDPEIGHGSTLLDGVGDGLVGSERNNESIALLRLHLFLCGERPCSRSNKGHR